MKNAEFKKLASEVAEPVHEMASRLVEQIIETVHETHIQPMRQGISSALTCLHYSNIEQAKEILTQLLGEPLPFRKQ